MIGPHERCEGVWPACKDRIIEGRKREDNLRNLDFTQRLKEQVHSRSWRRRLQVSEVLGRGPVHLSKKRVRK